MNGIECFKTVKNCLNTNIQSYLETSGGKCSNPYLNVVNFLTPVLIRHLWHHKAAVFLHRCLLCALPLNKRESSFKNYIKYLETNRTAPSLSVSVPCLCLIPLLNIYILIYFNVYTEYHHLFDQTDSAFKKIKLL